MPKTRTPRKNWADLRPGDRVTVSENGRFPFEATVDLLTEDSAVVWVFYAAGGGRRAFDHREDVTIRRISDDT